MTDKDFKAKAIKEGLDKKWTLSRSTIKLLKRIKIDLKKVKGVSRFGNKIFVAVDNEVHWMT